MTPGGYEIMAEKDFKIGQFVVYGTNGICSIEDITEMSFTRGMEKALYYILKPEAANASTIFVPANNEKLMSKMRVLMSKEDIDELILGTRGKSIKWDSDRRYRTENFHDILAGGVTEDLILMISCIYMRKRELIAQNKKLPSTDSNMLKTAEKLVEEEFSCVLGISPEEVSGYIRKLLDVPESDE